MAQTISKPADLDKLYDQAESVDKHDFAKMRSNLLLIAGDHYNRKGQKGLHDRLKNYDEFEKSMKLRLTKNHFGKIAHRYANIITSVAPDVKPMPKHEKEIQDQKSAELYGAIWQDGKEINDFHTLKLDLVDDFVGMGEVYSKLYFDQGAGALVGYEQAVDPMTGEPIFLPDGSPMPDQERPQYEGQIKFERVYAFNVILEPSCDGFKDSSYVCIRKSVPLEVLREMFPQKAEKIRESGEKPFLVFDIDQGYRQSDSKKEVLLKEWYFRPCAKYPKGYYYIHITGEILDEGELPSTPDGRIIFPIIAEYAEKIQTKRRGMSPLNPLRSYTREINRAASKIAETQISLGDDKLIVMNGSKISSGARLSGIRAITVTGQPPTILAGRSGDQYVAYMQGQIQEMYQVAELDNEDAMESQLEPILMLYRAGSQKRKFSRYIKRFESFLKKLCETYIDMAKTYYSDDRYVRAVGRNEAVNIAEFKKVVPQHVQIVIEATTEDLETRLGRQVSTMNILQYVGSQLDQNSIGRLMRNMPYGNFEDSFTDLTINDDMAMNDMLALDRGELPVVQVNDKHEYLIQRANSRMKQPDFKIVSDEVKENYQLYIQAHSDVLEQEKQAMIRAQSGFIPDSGAMVKADYYVVNPEKPEDKASRAEFPVMALEWLWNKLQEQGTYKKVMQDLPPSAVMAAEGQVSPSPMPPPDGMV